MRIDTDTDNLSPETIISMVRDFSQRIEEMKYETRRLVKIIGELRVENEEQEAEKEDLRKRNRDLQDRGPSGNQIASIRRLMAQQLCDVAEKAPSFTSALSICGALKELDFKILAVKAFKTLTSSGLRDSHTAVKDWRNRV